MKITNPRKSVVDDIRYRGKIGFDVALEALREGMKEAARQLGLEIDIED